MAESFLKELLGENGWRVQPSTIVALRVADAEHTIVTYRNARRGPMFRRTRPERAATIVYLDHDRRTVTMHPLRIEEMGLADLLEGTK